MIEMLCAAVAAVGLPFLFLGYRWLGQHWRATRERRRRLQEIADRDEQH